MKRLFIVIFLMAFLISVPASYASPERMELKDSRKMAKEKASRAAIKNMDLNDIEDPAARRAIGEILNYLSLQSKK